MLSIIIPSIISLLFLSVSVQAQSKKTRLLHTLEHVALGAGVEIAVSRTAGGPGKFPAGVVAAGLVAALKEGSDAVCGSDTKKMAAIHAATILGGAGVAVAIKH